MDKVQCYVISKSFALFISSSSLHVFVDITAAAAVIVFIYSSPSFFNTNIALIFDSVVLLLSHTHIHIHMTSKYVHICTNAYNISYTMWKWVRFTPKVRYCIHVSQFHIHISCRGIWQTFNYDKLVIQHSKQLSFECGVCVCACLRIYLHVYNRHLLILLSHKNDFG